MRAPISVVIPTLNAADGLPACLAALVEGLEAGLIREVILSDGGSTDATMAVAQAWGAEVVQGAPSRGKQLKDGCAAAQGDWLLVVHADSILQPGWSLAAMKHMQSRKAGWFQLQFDAKGLAAKIVAGWANMRSRWGLPYGDQGVLLPKTLYAQCGGYLDQPLMEDVALARRLSKHLAPIDAVIVTSAAKYQAQGWGRRGLRNLWTLIRYFCGVAPAKLAAAYRR